MNPLQILLAILLAILLFGAGVSTGYLVKSSEVAKTSTSGSTASTSKTSESRTEVREQAEKTITLHQPEGQPAVVSSSGEGFMERIAKSGAEGSPMKRYAAWSEAVQALNPTQIANALAEVQGMKDSRELMQLRMMLLSRWAESDPKAALGYAQGLGSAAEKRQAFSSVISSWGAKDFPAAKAWVEALPSGMLRKEAMQTLLMAEAQRNPAAAMGLAESLPSDQALFATMVALGSWVSKDVDAAVSEIANEVVAER